jgi:hypothetical protein
MWTVWKPQAAALSGLWMGRTGALAGIEPVPAAVIE